MTSIKDNGKNHDTDIKGYVGSLVLRGERAKVVIPETSKIAGVVTLNGKNSKLVLEDNVIWRGNISISGGSVYIGQDTIARGVDIVAGAAKVSVGQGCLLSWGCTILATDSHPIYDLDSGKILNLDANISIKDNVWVGRNCHILKGSCINDGSIIGLGSIVTRDIKSLSLAVGCPAKVIRTNVSWKPITPERRKNLSMRLLRRIIHSEESVKL